MIPAGCGSGKKYKKCHEAFDAKVDMLRQKGYPDLDHKLIKTPEQIEKIKESCKINVQFLTTWQNTSKPAFPQRRSTAGFMRRPYATAESRPR